MVANNRSANTAFQKKGNGRQPSTLDDLNGTVCALLTCFIEHGISSTCDWWWCQWIKRIISILSLMLFFLSFTVISFGLTLQPNLNVLQNVERFFILYSSHHVKGSSVPKIESNVRLQGISSLSFFVSKYLPVHHVGLRISTITIL